MKWSDTGFNEVRMFPFNTPILLRAMWTISMVINDIKEKRRKQLSANKLPTIVWSKSLNLTFKLSRNKSFEVY